MIFLTMRKSIETLKLFLLMDTILFYIPKPHKWRIYLVVTPCCWGAVRECEIYFFLFLSLVELVVVLEVRIVVTKIVLVVDNMT